jgi:hypothetical protein
VPNPRNGHSELAEIRERVVAYAVAELSARGIPFDRVVAKPSPNPAYDALVEVWRDRRARIAGVRLPGPANPA